MRVAGDFASLLRSFWPAPAGFVDGEGQFLWIPDFVIDKLLRVWSASMRAALSTRFTCRYCSGRQCISSEIRRAS
jgi:hypothetical protein